MLTMYNVTQLTGYVKGKSFILCYMLPSVSDADISDALLGHTILRGKIYVSSSSLVLQPDLSYLIFREFSFGVVYSFGQVQTGVEGVLRLPHSIAQFEVLFSVVQPVAVKVVYLKPFQIHIVVQREREPVGFHPGVPKTYIPIPLAVSTVADKPRSVGVLFDRSPLVARFDSTIRAYSEPSRL